MGMEKPTISNDNAVDQAGRTIRQYLYQALEHIDDIFGEGYAHKNPNLVGQCVTAQALDFATTSITAALWEVKQLVDCVASSLDNIASEIACSYEL